MVNFANTDYFYHFCSNLTNPPHMTDDNRPLSVPRRGACTEIYNRFFLHLKFFFINLVVKINTFMTY